MVLLVALCACAHESSAPKCDEAAKQLLATARSDAYSDVKSTQETYDRLGGSTINDRNGAHAMFRQRTAELGVFAEQHPECFTAGERAELIALTRLINAG